ncbi:membrane associated rhomboid family serine protease [Streptosporangium becharense]|uniref:Membrane associated rhomboid family serine protease n=1 Tax=Streptosporangium becharense TaxID=1816182 RepID=A0A7W9MH78_9ACTN|nr:rhomboid family intramembrane serine protease [Streptosporangium becharense]MBB2908813.1 membrane associated rhomboid family serine protease [Streptosporangium becharense]MBB5820169.1 membrane associated rhomboid family serine protease [Streptosporangium becharense]
MTTRPPNEPETAAPTCYRHPDRETYVRCQRCERPICPDCMRDAAVGFQCPECVAEGNKTVRQAQAVFGGRAVVTPWVTWTLLAVNVLAYVAENLDVDRVVGNFAMNSLAVAYGGEWWRLITGAFLHQPLGGGFAITHILFNMWVLYAIGPDLERRLGSARFLTLYLLAALGGSVAIYLFGIAAVGASGAIFGLFGALFVLARRLGYDARGVLWLLGINVVITFVVPNISWQGHLGGLVVGSVIAAIFAFAPRKNRSAVQWAGCAAALVVLVALVLLLPPFAANAQFGIAG